VAYANEFKAPFASKGYMFYIPISIYVKRMVETTGSKCGNHDSLMDCNTLYFFREV
jgi:hypothetical protein